MDAPATGGTRTGSIVRWNGIRDESTITSRRNGNTDGGFHITKINNPIHNDLSQLQPALEYFRKSLQLDPSQDELRFRIWTIRSRFDDRIGATEELKEYLDSLKGEQKRSWTVAIGLYLIGSLPEKTFLKFRDLPNSKKQSEISCVMSYYVGIKRLIMGDKVGAADFFQECLSTGETSFSEYYSADAELKALKKVLPSSVLPP
jgi:lipoprotein NlpI